MDTFIYLNEGDRWKVKGNSDRKSKSAEILYVAPWNTSNLSVNAEDVISIVHWWFLTVHNSERRDEKLATNEVSPRNEARSALTNLKRYSRVYPTNLG